MELILRAAWVVAAVLVLAGFTWQIEPRLLALRIARSGGPAGPGPDMGPAAPVFFRSAAPAANPDRWLYPAGPITAFLGVLFAMVVIPFGPNLLGRDLGIGVFYFIVVMDFLVLGLSVGGWGANTRSAVEVYYRATAQLVSYVVPLGLAYIGAIMMARSLSTVAIVEAQSGVWFVLLQPVGFTLYLATGAMQAYRSPFLEPFSSRIDHGAYAAYGGFQAVLWRITMSATLFLVAAMGAVLYLGGWKGPLLPAPLWMLLKSSALLVILVVLGSRIPPLTTGRMLEFSWKVLTPVGLANVLLVGILILAGAGPS